MHETKDSQDAGTIEAFLERALPVEGLSREQIEATARAARNESFAAGTTILLQGGAPAEFLYVIREGFVQILVDRTSTALVRTTFSVVGTGVPELSRP